MASDISNSVRASMMPRAALLLTGSRIGAISCITALRTVRREAAAGDSTKASARRPLIIPSPSGGHHASAEFFAGEDSVEDAASGAGRDAHLFDAGVKRA